jgi:hypothetical protein
MWLDRITADAILPTYRTNAEGVELLQADFRAAYVLVVDWFGAHEASLGSIHDVGQSAKLRF